MITTSQNLTNHEIYLPKDDWIVKHPKKELSDVRYVNKFLGLLSLKIWFRIFITRELSLNTSFLSMNYLLMLEIIESHLEVF